MFILKLVKSIFGITTSNRPAYTEPIVSDEPRAWTRRGGQPMAVGLVFEAWTSGDLSRMLGALDTQTNPVDRHFLLMCIVNETYRLRSDFKMAEKCLEVAQMHLDYFPVIAPALKREFDDILPRVSTFQHYATVLTERGEFDLAIKVCETAIVYGLDDGTKGGYRGRIERIKKKATIR
jgi:hypothetical protein